MSKPAKHGRESGADKDVIELVTVIRDLRTELEKAVAAADGAALRFELGPIELEVTVVVGRSKDGSGKLSFWVVQAGAGRTIDTTDTQRIKLTLTPKLTDTGLSVHVAGSPETGEG